MSSGHLNIREVLSSSVEGIVLDFAEAFGPDKPSVGFEFMHVCVKDEWVDVIPDSGH